MSPFSFFVLIHWTDFYDFLYILLDVALSTLGLFLKERICSQRSKFFLSRVDPPQEEKKILLFQHNLMDKGGKNENGRVISPISVHIHPEHKISSTSKQGLLL